MLVLLSLNLSFVFELGYPNVSFWFNTMKFSAYLIFYKYKCTFELIDMRLGFIKYTCPDLANRGYYNLVSELRLTDSGEGPHEQCSVAQLGSVVGR